MELHQKIEILTDSAKYDVSCASSGTKKRREGGLLGTPVRSGICHSWSADGRCISLLKILQTNNCIYDCAYCRNRRNNDIRRASLTPKEIAEVTTEFYKKNYIEGLFLSSAILKSPDYTMEIMIKTLSLLRNQYGFNGYIHTKLIPGADTQLINRAGLLADRVSVNIELPSRKSLNLLAPEKKINSIITPMKTITQKLVTYRSERAVIKHVPVFAPAGQSTQLVIGATLDSDYQIMALSSWLYKKMNLKRVYYSAYVPVNNDKNLPVRIPNLLTREHRLYQADWLLRFYGFSTDELFQESPYYLDQNCDPKLAWALQNPGYFPVEINTANYTRLLRVPGLGVISARKIVSLRKVKKIVSEDLPKLGIVMKRAKYFVTVQGKSTGFLSLYPDAIRRKILGPENEAVQLDLFSSYPQFELPVNNSSPEPKLLV